MTDGYGLGHLRERAGGPYTIVDVAAVLHLWYMDRGTPSSLCLGTPTLLSPGYTLSSPERPGLTAPGRPGLGLELELGLGLELGLRIS